MFVAYKYVISSGLNAWHALVWLCDNPNMILVLLALCGLNLNDLHSTT